MIYRHHNTEGRTARVVPQFRKLRAKLSAEWLALASLTAAVWVVPHTSNPNATLVYIRNARPRFVTLSAGTGPERTHTADTSPCEVLGKEPSALRRCTSYCPARMMKETSSRGQRSAAARAACPAGDDSVNARQRCFAGPPSGRCATGRVRHSASDVALMHTHAQGQASCTASGEKHERQRARGGHRLKIPHPYSVPAVSAR